jgi:hypothetical protein
MHEEPLEQLGLEQRYTFDNLLLEVLRRRRDERSHGVANETNRGQLARRRRGPKFMPVREQLLPRGRKSMRYSQLKRFETSEGKAVAVISTDNPLLHRSSLSWA